MNEHELTELFCSECTHLLTRLEKIVMQAEAAEKLLEATELFRLLHTLKGSSAMMNYAPLADSAHEFENILAAVRDKAEPLAGKLLSELIDAGLNFSEYFRQQLTYIERGSKPEVNDELLSQLTALTEATGATKKTAAAKLAVAQAPATLAANEIQIKIKLRSCPLPHMRALVIVKAVAPLCDSFSTEPKDLAHAAEYDDSIAKDGFVLTFAPKEGVTDAAVMQKLIAQPYVGTVEETELAAKATESAPNTKTTDSDSLTETDAAQAAVNELQGYLNEIAAAVNTIEAVAHSEGRLSPLNKPLTDLRRTVAQASLITDKLAGRSLESVFMQMQLTVRSMAKELGKEIKVVCIGTEVQADKSILQLLSDSLIHMVRNAADHGIEPPQKREALGKPRVGTIKLNARKQGDTLLVSVTDDGAGINREGVLESCLKRGLLDKPPEEYTDEEVYALLLGAGVSSRNTVTRFSGRGVGLDTAASRVRRVGGSIEIESKPQVGSTFTLKIPITLSVLDAVTITVQSGDELVVPIAGVRRVLAGIELKRIVEYSGEEYFSLDYSIEPKEARKGCAVLLTEEYGKRFIPAEAVSLSPNLHIKPLPDYVCDALGSDNIYSGAVQGSDYKLRFVIDLSRLCEAAEKRVISERQTNS